MKVTVIFFCVISICFLSFVNAEPTLDISGGATVVAHAYPFAVAVEFAEEDCYMAALYPCAGALISQNYILTSAECVPKNPYNASATVNPCTLVYLGAQLMYNGTDTNETRCFEWTRHEGFNETTLENNIALIKLPTPADLSGPNIRIIDLDSSSDTFVGQTATVIGWGLTEGLIPNPELQSLNLTVISNNECANASARYETLVKNSNICLGQPDKAGPCAGDDGVPLMIDNGLVGVMSYSNGWCGTSTSPSIYTRIYSYLDWIIEHSDVTF